MVKSAGKSAVKERQDCTICMVRAVNCKTIECSHQFCYRCLSKWTRRKGNCPICRQDVRKIHYKNRVIEPQFLKIFDEEKIVQSEELQLGRSRAYYGPVMVMDNEVLRASLFNAYRSFQMFHAAIMSSMYYLPPS